MSDGAPLDDLHAFSTHSTNISVIPTVSHPLQPAVAVIPHTSINTSQANVDKNVRSPKTRNFMLEEMNGRHYKTLPSNTSEDDERLLQGMSSEAAAYDFKTVTDFSLGTNRPFSNLPDLPDDETGVGVASSCYDDFHTIDWVRDIQRDRLRHRQLARRCADHSWKHTLLQHYDSLNAWICVFLVGCLAGGAASLIDIGAQWMTDLRYGICSEAVWFNREQCCWGSPNFHYDSLEDCPEWNTWSELIANSRVGFGSQCILFIMFVSIALAFSGLAALLVRSFAPYACGSGIPEIKTILSGFIIKGYLGFWTLLIKATTMMLSVSAGLNLGKEGPLVHIASCCGNLFVRFFPKYGQNEAKKREIISAACAAGVSVAFGAPLGGILFSLEEASYYFPLKTLYRSFFCALVATSVLTFINPLGTDHAVLFYVEHNSPWYVFELFPIVVLGIFGGVCGALFIKCNIQWCKYRKTNKLGKYPIPEVLAVTMITAVVSYFNEYTWMPTNELIRQLFSECTQFDTSDLCDYAFNASTTANPNPHRYPFALAGPQLSTAVWKLVIALAVKGTLTVFTFGIKIPAGLFIPSMAVGAIFGRLVGIALQQIAYHHPDSWPFNQDCTAAEDCINPGFYAIVGAAAVLAGVTRMTVSLVVIMFELTGGLLYIVPLMAATMTAKWVGDALGKLGIYDEHIKLNGYPYLDSKEEFSHTTLAGDVMKPRPNDAPLAVLTLDGMTFDDVQKLMQTNTFNGFPVVLDRDSYRLCGYVLRRDLMLAIRNAQDIDPNVVSQSKIYFNNEIPYDETQALGPTPLKLRKIVELSPFQITVQTPMDVVLDVFVKLGLRTLLVTNNGRLLGVITKKDVLRHIAELTNQDPSDFLFH